MNGTAPWRMLTDPPRPNPHEELKGPFNPSRAVQNSPTPRSGVSAQTPRPAIRALGPRTRTVVEDRQFHDPWPEDRFGPRRSGFRRSGGRIPVSAHARRGSRTGGGHAFDPCRLAGDLSWAGLW